MGLLAKFTQKVAPVLGKFGGLVPVIGPQLQRAGQLLSKIGPKAGAIIGGGAAFGLGEAAVTRALGPSMVGGPPGMQAGGGGGGLCIIGPDGHKYKQSRPRPASPGGRWYRCRPRGRGLSARDIRGCQKVMRVVQHFGYKPKLKHRSKRR